MKRWRCTVCGYIHVGDSPPEKCPVCGVGPEFFEEVTEVINKEVNNDVNKGENKTFAGDEITSVSDIELLKEINLTEEDKIRINPALFKISYGLYIITSTKGEKVNGQCANTGFQITSEPPRVAIGINKKNLTHEFIQASGVFVMNILGEHGHNLVRRFGYSSGRDMDKFAGIDYTTGITGAPIIKDSIAYLECRIIRDKAVDAGTHTLFLADVVDGKLVGDMPPMTYEYFRKTK